MVWRELRIGWIQKSVAAEYWHHSRETKNGKDADPYIMPLDSYVAVKPLILKYYLNADNALSTDKLVKRWISAKNLINGKRLIFKYIFTRKLVLKAF